MGLWLLRGYSRDIPWTFQIVSTRRGRMVTSPNSEVAKSALRNSREASLGVMFFQSGSEHWMRDSNLCVLPDLPTCPGRYIFTFFVGGSYSGKVIFAILDYTVLFSSDSLAFSFSVIFCKNSVSTEYLQRLFCFCWTE